ncbi:MAG: sulfite exporter TauE/SafE family protein [Candidatus Thermoplasmatota archaeon]|nr:sulfite exporter TauE/SafE family protein [Candidatus Thermoplasmatota archaeon]
MLELVPLIIILAFLFETMDSSAGMGFGTGLTPLLFLLGYDPLQVVPILLLSEAITGFTASYFHHEFQNVSFSFRKPYNQATKITGLIAITGCFAIILSVVLTYAALELPKSFIKTYVGILVLAMGIIGMIRLKSRTMRYRPKLLTGFAALAGFNKGIGAGGYGPVVMMGQLFSGIYEKTATAIVSLAEGIVSLIGFAAFLLISSYGVTIDYLLLPSIFTGGFIAAIISPYMVRVLPNKMWRIVIPVYAILMGILTLAKVTNIIP